ncbi:MAG: type Z 30S ribosomal protein S14 [Patescibacteria group bacterium]|nr:type Z 30S ribosomal protein S14 [Patescibacteria group bacterium]
MARKALIEKAQRKPKYSTRKQTRCRICGRSKGYLKKFEMCRICFRERASKGEVPGVRKASW